MHGDDDSRFAPGMTMLLRLLLVFGLILTSVAAPPARAGDVPGIDNKHFRTFGIAQGLSQATARVIVQDRSGFVWIGTQNGLSRFDGYEFRNYKSDRDDPWALSQNHVWALAADSDGSLWVGTQAGGLNHYDPLLDRFVAYRHNAEDPHALASNHVTAVLLDHDNRVWVANAAGRMQWFDRNTETFVDTPMATQSTLRMVRSMLQTVDGGIWLGTRDGLWRVDADGTGLREYRAAENHALDVFALAQAIDGDVWVGTAENGLYRLSSDGGLVRHYVESDSSDATQLHDDGVRALLADADGGLWIAGNSRGLAHLDSKSQRFSRYAHDPARSRTIAANRLSAFMRSRSGALFVGSWANGFSVQNPRTEAFTQIDSIAGDARTLPSPQALTVWGDADGMLWVGVLEGGGLVQIDPERGLVARHVHDPKRPESLSHNFVQYVMRARDGSLWIATMGGGINRLRRGSDSFEHFRHDPDDPTSLAEDSILFLYEDRAGTIWVGSANQGLDELCASCTGFVHHPHIPGDPLSLGADTIGGIVETPAGDLWLALRSGGLDRYNRAAKQFEHFRSDRANPESIASDALTTLTLDSRGELWIGTQGGGVSHLLPGSESNPRFESFGVKEGLATEAVGAILEDTRGKLWISTTTGISRFDREQRRFLNLGPNDGTQAKGYWVNGAARLPGGRLVFSGLAGISVFDPVKIVASPTSKPLAIRLLLKNVPVPLRWRDPDSPLDVSLWSGGKVDLRHDQDNVTIEFAALDFSDPESIHYSYRLEGHDAQWIDTPASRRLATFTGLHSGNYQLRLRARRDGEDWSSEPFSVEMRVAPSPLASPLAFSGYALSALLLAYLTGKRVQGNLRVRTAAQEAIRASEERLKLSLWGSGSELWDVDLRTRRMHRENKLPYLAVTGETIGESFDSYLPFVHKDDLPGFNAALAAHLKGTKTVFEASYRTLDQSGNWVWMLTRGRLVDRDSTGYGLRMAGTTHDINALKRAEEALIHLNEELEQRVDRRTSDLRATNIELQDTLDRLTLTQRQLLEAEKLASLGGMVAGIAHEINTPLGVSVTAASHLVEEATHLSRQIAIGALSRSELERFERAALDGSRLILRNLQRADHLVRSFKQVAVDQSSEDRRVIDLGACINEILITLGPALKKTRHRVEVLCEVPVVCETAPGALYQIISNVVMNSLTHGFEDETAGLISISIHRDGDSAVIDYRDNGIGMDEATRARIYDPFFTTRRGKGGSGLGMHIVYTLVTQALGGTIAVNSEPGHGIHLCIRFKVQRSDAAV